MNTVREYFAEGAQSFFNCHISVHPPNGIHNNIATRSQLKRYDPELYRVLEEVFPCKNKYYWCHRGRFPPFFTVIKTHAVSHIAGVDFERNRPTYKIQCFKKGGCMRGIV